MKRESFSGNQKILYVCMCMYVHICVCMYVCVCLAKLRTLYGGDVTVLCKLIGSPVQSFNHHCMGNWLENAIGCD